MVFTPVKESHDRYAFDNKTQVIYIYKNIYYRLYYVAEIYKIRFLYYIHKLSQNNMRTEQ